MSLSLATGDNFMKNMHYKQRCVNPNCSYDIKCSSLVDAVDNEHLECYDYLINFGQEEEYEFYLSCEKINKYLFALFPFFEYLVYTLQIDAFLYDFTMRILQLIDSNHDRNDFIKVLFNSINYDVEDLDEYYKKFIKISFLYGHVRNLVFLYEKRPNLFDKKYIQIYINGKFNDKFKYVCDKMIKEKFDNYSGQTLYAKEIYENNNDIIVITSVPENFMNFEEKCFYPSIYFCSKINKFVFCYDDCDMQPSDNSYEYNDIDDFLNDVKKVNKNVFIHDSKQDNKISLQILLDIGALKKDDMVNFIFDKILNQS